MFTKVRLLDDVDRACEDETSVRHLGTISLKFYRIRIEGIDEAPEFFTPRRVLLHESCRKATVSHQTS